MQFKLLCSIRSFCLNLSLRQLMFWNFPTLKAFFNWFLITFSIISFFLRFWVLFQYWIFSLSRSWESLLCFLVLFVLIFSMFSITFYMPFLECQLNYRKGYNLKLNFHSFLLSCGFLLFSLQLCGEQVWGVRKKTLFQMLLSIWLIVRVDQCQW